jgi:hypothetical protein
MITSLYKITKEKPTVRDILAISVPFCILIEKYYHVCDYYSHVFEFLSDVSERDFGESCQVISTQFPGVEAMNASGFMYLCPTRYLHADDDEKFPFEEMLGMEKAIESLNGAKCRILCEGGPFPRPKLEIEEGIALLDPYEYKC